MKKIMKLSSTISLFVLILFSSCTKNEITNITLNKSTSNLILGQTDSLIAKLTSTGDIKNLSLSWSSSNPTVATVSTAGFIQALSKGTTSITAMAGGKSATCQITVDDKIVTNFNFGELQYWGDYYKTGKSNNFIVYLLNSTDTLQLEINTDLTATDSIPSGNYNMILNIDSTNYNQFIPKTIVPANFTTPGSWYYNLTIVTPIINGNALVINTNNNYSIQYNLIDYFGNSISGTYQGILAYYDKSAKASPALKSKIKANRLIKNSHYRLLLKR